MNQPRPLQKRHIVKAQRAKETRGSADSRHARWFAQIPDIKRQARRVKEKRRKYVGVRHQDKFTRSTFSLCLGTLRALPALCAKSLCLFLTGKNSFTTDGIENREKTDRIGKTCRPQPVGCCLFLQHYSQFVNPKVRNNETMRRCRQRPLLL